MGIRNIKIPLKKIAKDAFLQGVPSNCQAYIDEILPQLFRLARNPNWLKPEEERDPHDKSVREPITKMLWTVIRDYLKFFRAGSKSCPSRILVVVGDKDHYMPKYKIPVQKHRSEQYKKSQKGKEDGGPYPPGSCIKGNGIFNPITRQIEQMDVIRLLHTRGEIRTQLMETAFQLLFDNIKNMPGDYLVIWDTSSTQPPRCIRRGMVYEWSPLTNQIGEGEVDAVWYYQLIRREFPMYNVVMKTKDTDLIGLLTIHMENPARPGSCYHVHWSGEYLDVELFLRRMLRIFTVEQVIVGLSLCDTDYSSKSLSLGGIGDELMWDAWVDHYQKRRNTIFAIEDDEKRFSELSKRVTISPSSQKSQIISDMNDLQKKISKARSQRIEYELLEALEKTREGIYDVMVRVAYGRKLQYSFKLPIVPSWEWISDNAKSLMSPPHPERAPVQREYALTDMNWLFRYWYSLGKDGLTDKRKTFRTADAVDELGHRREKFNKNKHITRDQLKSNDPIEGLPGHTNELGNQFCKTHESFTLVSHKDKPMYDRKEYVKFLSSHSSSDQKHLVDFESEIGEVKCGTGDNWSYQPKPMNDHADADADDPDIDDILRNSEVLKMIDDLTSQHYASRGSSSSSSAPAAAGAGAGLGVSSQWSSH